MLDRALGFQPAQQESYYFQLIPNLLTLINQQSQLPPPGTTYRFSVYKGQQKFDQSRVPIEADFTTVDRLPVLPITSCHLNFYIPTVNRQRRIDFNLKMVQREQNVDYGIGEYAINVNQLIQQFKTKSITRHQLKSNFSEDYELQFEIYVNTSKVNLEKNIREHKSEEASSLPIKNRKEEEEKPEYAQKDVEKSYKKQQTPSRDVQSAPEAQQDPPAEAANNNLEQVEEVQQNQSPRPSSPQKIEKPEASVKSKHSIPLLQTKYKPISKQPAELKMSESQRLSAGGSQILQKVAKGQDDQTVQQKIFLWLFLGIGVLLIYWAMIPSSRV